jgi:hypothetical protein
MRGGHEVRRSRRRARPRSPAPRPQGILPDAQIAWGAFGVDPSAGRNPLSTMRSGRIARAATAARSRPSSGATDPARDGTALARSDRGDGPAKESTWAVREDGAGTEIEPALPRTVGADDERRPRTGSSTAANALSSRRTRARRLSEHGPPPDCRRNGTRAERIDLSESEASVHWRILLRPTAAMETLTSGLPRQSMPGIAGRGHRTFLDRDESGQDPT